METIDTSTITLQNRRMIEIRESQLWWLAVLIIALLGIGVFVTSAGNDEWLVSPQLNVALSTSVVRTGLILATLLICAYFRDCARSLRRENGKLVADLAEYGRQLENKNREVSKLKDLSDQLIEMSDLRSGLDLVIGMAADLIGADTASIMLRNDNEDTLSILVSRGLSESILKSADVRLGASIAGMVAKDGKPLILNSDELTGELARRASRGDQVVSSVVVPIQSGAEIHGVISVARLRGGICFTENDLSVIATLANQASLVIQKVKLLDSLRDQVDKLASTIEKLHLAQAELMQSEKLASIGQLAGGVAHEINNPLQVVLGRTEMLILDEKDPDRLGQLRAIEEHTIRISEIVSNLLSFSRQNKDTEFRELDVNLVLNKTLALLEPQMCQDNIKVVRDMQEWLYPVSGHPGQLQQVFTNIIMNACQAMADHGSGGTLAVRSENKDSSIEITISDTGPGIPANVLDMLFEPFFTTKAEGKGTGLGLSIAYGIIQTHGGDLQARNTPDKGACFSVVLPIAKRE